MISLENRIIDYSKSDVDLLKRITSANLLSETQRIAITNLTTHLQQLYSITQVERPAKNISQILNIDLEMTNDKPCIFLEDKNFCLGHDYFSNNGIYRMIEPPRGFSIAFKQADGSICKRQSWAVPEMWQTHIFKLSQLRKELDILASSPRPTSTIIITLRAKYENDIQTEVSRIIEKRNQFLEKMTFPDIIPYDIKTLRVSIRNSINFLAALPQPITAEIDALRKELENDLMVQLVERHRQYLEKHNLPNIGTRALRNNNHRVARCWSCHVHLDNEIDLECARCGWILCLCGACGCGRS